MNRGPHGQFAEPGLLFGIALGFLSVLGPSAIDLYLPAMPEMARAMAVESGAVQRTLSAFFLGLALAQIPVGSLGDRFGRRRPLIGGLLLFVGASIACGIASDLDQLVALRFLQGMGACAGTSSARAMIRDIHSGHRAARLMAFTFLVIGLSPVLAPLAGSLLLELVSWRGLFFILAAMGGTAVLLVSLFLPETLPAERRLAGGGRLIADYKLLAGSSPFMGWTVVAGLATTIPFAYVTAAPFIFTHLYALDSTLYCILLALNAGASIVATQFAPGQMQRRGGRRLVSLAAGMAGGATILIALLGSVTSVSLVVFQLYSMFLFAMAGLMLTPAATMALDASRGGAGAAAGLLGTLQLAVTALASATVSLFPSFSLLPLLGVLGAALALMLLIVAGLGRVSRACPADKPA